MNTSYYTEPKTDSFISRYGFRPANRKGKVNLLLVTTRNLMARRSQGKIAPVEFTRETVGEISPLAGLKPSEVDWVANHASFEAQEIHGKAKRCDHYLTTALVRTATKYRDAAVVVFGRNS